MVPNGQARVGNGMYFCMTLRGGDKNIIKTTEKRESEGDSDSNRTVPGRPQARNLRGTRFVLRVSVLLVLSASIQPLLLLHGAW